MKAKCTKCGWEGKKDDLKQGEICPVCAAGHNTLTRLLWKGGQLECARCGWTGPKDMAVNEPECPKCSDPYLEMNL